MENFQVYRDIQARTGGDIYIGVVADLSALENPHLYEGLWNWWHFPEWRKKSRQKYGISCH